jgi:hypothetical protein
MPGKAGRTTEQEIGLAVVRYLAATLTGGASIYEIKRHLNKNFPFTPADREQSETRPNEEMWEQQVRNLVSHRKSNDNVIGDGLVEYRPRRLAITDAGRNFAKRKFG